MIASSTSTQDKKTDGERIAKVIARSGLCSRREAEGLIDDRRVSVNGAVIESAALDILPSDVVLVDGRPLSAREPPRLWRYYKPKGRVTTHKDPEGRPTVFEALPQELPRLISVGRLDFNTEGLLLLTNDGELARHLELPSTGWTRRYRVRAFGDVSAEQLKELADGITINRMRYGPVQASLEREQGDNVWISISIREGKNREVRRIMEHLGLSVNRLIRISFGPFILGELEPGQIEEVKTQVLKDQLGPRLSRQLGVRREVMREERRLEPHRGKPSQPRRKPAAEERPRREPVSSPLKRRRIFEAEGTEGPRVEFVPERRAAPSRFKPKRADEGTGFVRRKPPQGEDFARDAGGGSRERHEGRSIRQAHVSPAGGRRTEKSFGASLRQETKTDRAGAPKLFKKNRHGKGARHEDVPFRARAERRENGRKPDDRLGESRERPAARRGEWRKPGGRPAESRDGTTQRRKEWRNPDGGASASREGTAGRRREWRKPDGSPKESREMPAARRDGWRKPAGSMSESRDGAAGRRESARREPGRTGLKSPHKGRESGFKHNSAAPNGEEAMRRSSSRSAKPAARGERPDGHNKAWTPRRTDGRAPRASGGRDKPSRSGPRHGAQGSKPAPGDRPDKEPS